MVLILFCSIDIQQMIFLFFFIVLQMDPNARNRETAKSHFEETVRCLYATNGALCSRLFAVLLQTLRLCRNALNGLIGRKKQTSVTAKSIVVLGVICIFSRCQSQMRTICGGDGFETKNHRGRNLCCLLRRPTAI